MFSSYCHLCRHCPHHETPAAVNRSLISWMRSVEQQQEFGLSVGESWVVQEQPHASTLPGTSLGSIMDEAGGSSNSSGVTGESGVHPVRARTVRVTHVNGSPRNVFEIVDYWLWKLVGKWEKRV